MQDLEEKYLELLINKCLNFENTKAVLINYHRENKNFITKLVQKLNKMGITDIYLDEEDPYKYHELLQKDIEIIKDDAYFNKDKWKEYAKKNANFLMLKSEYPNLMNDLDNQKVNYINNLILERKKDFYEKQKKNEVPWCIAVLPSSLWAKDLFPNDQNAYEKLFKVIGSFVLLNEKNPSESWDEVINNSNKLVAKLNKLKIKTLHYTNKKGTDFSVDISKDAIWCGIGSDTLCIVNLPSYEVFTSPLKDSAEGIIYGSKPLFYNNQKVDDFYFKFQKGKVIEYDAKEGKEVLDNIFLGKDMKFLGEIALVDKNTPIAKSEILLNTTLLDENASCHIAFGEGFPECLKNGYQLTDEELKNKGLNIATNHVDMMVGTKDLDIEVTTYDNKKIKIFQNGEFVI